MARAGRKRKDVARLNGRRDWRQLVEDPSLLTKWSRYRDRIGELGGDPHTASQAGKMHYLRHLTSLQVEAAERWTAYLAEYDRLILSMSRTPRPAPLERVQPGQGYIPTPEEVERFLARFQPAQDAILRAGSPALAALNRLCRDEASSSVLPEAKRALESLAVHFGLKQA
jgi:hypothetical protein